MTWKSSIYKAIKDISDLDFQRRAWLRLNGSNEVSSFTEICCTLFDDASFDDFVNQEPWAQTGLSESVRDEMRKLTQRLENYDEKGKAEADILVDPAWQVIVTQAKHVIEMMDKG
jgi:hypothetical protein